MCVGTGVSVAVDVDVGAAGVAVGVTRVGVAVGDTQHERRDRDVGVLAVGRVDRSDGGVGDRDAGLFAK